MVRAVMLFDAYEHLATLGHNLAVAGALCEAFDMAIDEAEQHRLYHEHGYRTDACWRPGCALETP